MFGYCSYGFYLLNAYTLINDIFRSLNNQKICLYSKNGKKITEFDYKESSKLDFFCKTITFVVPLIIAQKEDSLSSTENLLQKFSEGVSVKVYWSILAQGINCIYFVVYGNSKLSLELPEGYELYLVSNGTDETEITFVQSIEISL